MNSSVSRNLVVSVLLVTGSLLAVGCQSSKSTSTQTGTRPATSAGSTSSPSSRSTVQPATAVWPFAASATRYTDPVQAARGFAVDYLGFVDPIIGAFMQGDSRSGEVQVKASDTGPATTVMVRKLAPDETWWVLGAATSNLQLQSPAALASIASPVTLSGQSTAFEATVNFEIREDGTTTPLATGIVMGGANGQMGPFSKAVSFAKPTATRGAVILKTMSPKDGNIAEASVIRVQLS